MPGYFDQHRILGELYIDFGYAGALIANIIFGVAIGYMYRIVRDYDRLPRLISFGICAMMMLPFIDFGTALAKSINGFVLTFCAGLIIQRIIAPRVLVMFFPQNTHRQSRGRSHPAATGRPK